MENRKALRVKTRFDVLYSNGPSEGAGVLVDLSYSGARMDQASLQPDVGTRVRLYVFVQPIQPFEMIGHVVRVTDVGFALEWEVSDPDLRHLVDDVAAIVSTPQ